jgi:hypothetical protein
LPDYLNKLLYQNQEVRRVSEAGKIKNANEENPEASNLSRSYKLFQDFKREVFFIRLSP